MIYCPVDLFEFWVAVQPQTLDSVIFDLHKFLFLINAHVVRSVSLMKKFGSEISNEDDFEKFFKIGFRDQMGECGQNKLNSFRVEKLGDEKEVGK